MEEYGRHCEFEGCHALDFLPFKCLACSKMLCLTHRSGTMHNCGGVKVDATSLTCPVCLKSVVFNKGENVDAAWERHYVTTCTQKLPSPQPITTCSFHSCSASLKDSNRINCNRCSRLYCLAHRLPEEHQCLGLRGNRDNFLNKVSVQGTNGHQSNNINNRSKDSSSVKAKSIDAVKNITSHPKVVPLMQATPNGLQCPFCGLGSWVSADHLQGHINSEHAEPQALQASKSREHVAVPSSVFQGNGLANNLISEPTSGKECCPVCQAQFADAIQLVAHFETNHNQSKNSKSDCCLH